MALCRVGLFGVGYLDLKATVTLYVFDSADESLS